MKQKKRAKMTLSSKFSILLIIVFMIILCLGVDLTRDKLLRNADNMGDALAESYASQEQDRIDMYKMLMSLGAAYVKENIGKGYTRQEEEAWLAEYKKYLTEIMGEDIVRLYAVIDGKITSSISGEYAQTYNDSKNGWYQNALEADGKMVFSDPYADAVTGESYITLSQKINDRGDVFAMDVSLEGFHTYNNKETMLPLDSSYYLFDSDGNLIYHVIPYEATEEELNAYTEKLYDKLVRGSYDKYSATVEDLQGNQRGVYFFHMDNGWLSVVTIPVNVILQDNFNRTMLALVLGSFLLLVGISTFLIKENYESRKMRYVNDTLRILGDTYYAIYRVDYENGIYHSIKSSDDVKELLGEKGKYENLLKTVKNVVYEKTYKEFEESFSLENIRKLVNNKVYEFGGEYQRHFGDVDKWVSIKIIYKEELNLNEVLMCYREVDEERQSQMNQHILLENTLNSMKRMVKQKNEFFSNMSHDMRTPLNAIIGLSELAQKNKGDTVKVNEYMVKIEQSGKQLLNLINDVLDMSKIEQGAGVSLNYKSMNLSECIETSGELFREQAEKDGKTLSIVTDIKNTLVYGDNFRLTQVMNNLLSNAVKYSLPGDKIKVELTELEYQTGRSKYKIVVSDTGIGMSEQFLENLFEPFVRETTFMSKKVSGTGLGMPIVKSLVQQMSGEINVDSTLGKGTVFTIILPLQIAEAGKESPAPKKEVEEDFSLEGKTVLIAEDNEINMEIAEELMEMLGAKVIQAWDGEEALEQFKASPTGSIDVVLMDMQMPNMDGCSACRAIRRLPREDAKKVPVIAVTANAFAEDIAETTKAGMDAHIPKPIDFNALCKILKKIIRQKE